MSGTKKFVENRIIRAREQEARDGDLRRKITENNILTGHGKSEIRVEGMRRSRSEAAERMEVFMDYTFVKTEQDKEKRRQISQFEENLADELAKRKTDQMRSDMDRRRICDGSEELRALKERLHLAKVNKERSMQLLEIEVRRERERLVEHKLAEYMKNERLESGELEHKLVIEKNKQRERVKVINQQQIAMKESQRDEAHQVYMKEREQIEELVAKIAQEDSTEAETRAEKQRESREMLQKFMIEQKQKQEDMEREEREENERIEQYAQDKREREERLAKEKEEQEKEKTRILNAMLGQMEAKNKEQEEFEALCNDLRAEELEAESRRREELEMRKKLEDRQEMQNAYLFQVRAKVSKMANARVEEDKIRAELMKKFAEDDRLEQMAEHKRRMKVEQHKREADRLVELRREMYELARQQERDETEKLNADEGARQTIIEAERKRLIKEHASELRDFLPKHTLESMEDYQLFFKD
ncbi:unnamed protein product [Polarella glacialis]|uniref:Meiosis-specific nuclear structural protein 1 n=1 Tax=Polarella glacialis TaxID=89957 RepID=A0A813H4U8_POLGL|nr:unnamed protein product [Polarella glacialis]